MRIVYQDFFSETFMRNKIYEATDRLEVSNNIKKDVEAQFLSLYRTIVLAFKYLGDIVEQFYAQDFIYLSNQVGRSDQWGKVQDHPEFVNLMTGILLRDIRWTINELIRVASTNDIEISQGNYKLVLDVRHHGNITSIMGLSVYVEGKEFASFAYTDGSMGSMIGLKFEGKSLNELTHGENAKPPELLRILGFFLLKHFTPSTSFSI
jgi:hypothetical protein